jgi:hypothetical protein
MQYADEFWLFIKLPLNGYPRYTWQLAGNASRKPRFLGQLPIRDI